MASSESVTRRDRPRFFSGQLLTDEDLQAIVDWSLDRFRTAARRTGAGVFDGLRLEFDPNKPLTVTVNPGVAIDGNGQEIVVIEEEHVPISVTDIQKARAEGHGGEHENFGGVHVGRHVRTPFLLRMSLELKDQRRCPRLPTESDATRSEYSRIRERAKLEFVPEGPVSDSDGLAKTLSSDFEECSKIVAAFDERFGTGELTGSKVKEWFGSVLTSDPLQSFKFISRAAESSETDGAFFGSRENIAKLLFYIVLDRRLELAQRQSDKSVDPDRSAVTLGRVWIAEQVAENGEFQKPRILGIDPSPWLRGGKSVVSQAARQGEVNLLDLLWAPGEDAHRLCAERGFRVAEEVPLKLPDSLEWFEESKWLAQSPFVRAGDEVVVYTLTSMDFRRRVIGFSGRGARNRLDVEIVRVIEPSRAIPGELVTIRYEIRNTGETALDLSMTETAQSAHAQAQQVETDRRLAKDELYRFEFEMRVPDNAPVGKPLRIVAEAALSNDAGDQRSMKVDGTVEVLDPKATTMEVSCDYRSVGPSWFLGKISYLATVRNRGAGALKTKMLWDIEGLGSDALPEVSIDAGSYFDFEQEVWLRFGREARGRCLGSTKKGLDVSQEVVIRMPKMFDVWPVVLVFVVALLPTLVILLGRLNAGKEEIDWWWWWMATPFALTYGCVRYGRPSQRL